MLSGPWPGIVAAAIALIFIIIWSSYGSGDERQAMSAILEAQRHIAAVQDARAAREEPAVLRAAEADLLTAQTAFNQSQFDVAVEAALRASQTAQHLLANHPTPQHP